MQLHEAPEMYEKIVHEDDVRGHQVRLTVSTFRGVEYLSLRKYYLDFEEEWKPSSEGISMPLDFNNSKELFVGLVEILSLAEAKETIEKHFKEYIQDMYK